MSPATEQLKSTLSSLPEEERAELVHFLIQTLETGFDADIEQAWAAELDRRMDDIDSGREIGIPADVASARARAMIS